MKKSNPALDALKHHVTGAIERGEKQPIVEKRKYYTLCLRDDGPNKWLPEFGDYDRAIVQAELEAYTEHDYLKKNAKIISSGDTQAEIDAAVAELNK